jgi:hypothetical protein
MGIGKKPDRNSTIDKASKFVTLLVIIVTIVAILHLTGVIASHEPMWIYWTFLAASIIAGVWLIIKLRRWQIRPPNVNAR